MLILGIIATLIATIVFVANVPFFVVRTIPKESYLEVISSELGSGLPERISDFYLKAVTAAQPYFEKKRGLWKE